MPNGSGMRVPRKRGRRAEVARPSAGRLIGPFVPVVASLAGASFIPQVPSNKNPEGSHKHLWFQDLHRKNYRGSLLPL